MNKKVMLLAGGCVIIAVLFIILAFAGNKNQNGQKTSTGNQPRQEDQAGRFPQVTTVPEGDLSDYTSSYFNFSYASALNITEGIADAEGYTVVVKSPATFTPAFQIVVQSNPEDKVSLENIKNVLLAYQLKPATLTVGGNIPASVYTDVSGKTQQEVAVFSKNGYVYRIDLSYASEKKDAQVDAFYQEILSSFQPR